jgi:cell division septation protein DedD
VNVGGSYAVTGTTAITSGTMSFNAPASSVATTLSGGALGGGDAFTATGSFTWSGGTMAGTGTTVIGAGATLLITGSSSIYLNTRTLTNQGSVVWNGSNDLWEQGTALFNNAGTMTIQNNQSLRIYNWDPIVGVMNSGTVIKTGATGTTTIGVPFSNSGTVGVESGAVSFSSNGTDTGSFYVAGAGTLNFTGGARTLQAASSVSGAGTVGCAGATVNVGGSYAVTGTTAISSGTMNFNAPASSGATTLSGGTLGGNSTFTTIGAFTWSGGTMNGTGATTIAASATGAISGGNSKTLDTRTLNNAGASAWTGTGNVYFYNSAVLNNTGTFTAQNDQTFAVGSGAPAINNSGTFAKSIATGTSSIAGGINFTNTNTIGVQTGIINLGGNYAPPGSATLNITLGGLTVGTQFGRLAVSGATTLTGALNVALASGYMPNPGDSFRIVTAGTRTGAFTRTSGLDLGSGRYLTVSYDSTGVNLIAVQATPTPTSSATITPNPSNTPSPSATPTVTATGTVTSTPTATATPTPSATATPTESQYVAAILADSLVAYWRLGESSGTVAADGSGHSATCVGGPTLGVGGALVSNPDTAVAFGGGLGVSVDGGAGAVYNTASVSVEAWVRTVASGDMAVARRINSADGSALPAVRVIPHFIAGRL